MRAQCRVTWPEQHPVFRRGCHVSKSTSCVKSDRSSTFVSCTHQSAIHLLPAGRGACVECLATSTIPLTSFSWSLRLGQQTATTTRGTLNTTLMFIVASLWPHQVLGETCYLWLTSLGRRREVSSRAHHFYDHPYPGRPPAQAVAPVE